jgi:anti-anti-sigma factor
VAPSITRHEASQAAQSQTFGISATVDRDEAVLGLWGQFDLVTAPTLSVFIDAVMQFGRYHVVLDLARLEFTDASGLRPMVEAWSRLKAEGGSLTVRSPSAMAAKIREITGLAPELGLRSPTGAPAEFASGSLSPTPPAAPGAGLSAIDPQSQAMLGALLDLVVVSAQAAMPDAHGVSLTLERACGFVTAAYSDELVASMDADQYATDQGPCLIAAR